MIKKKKILFMIPLPPPIHGAAMMGEYLRTSRLITSMFNCTFVNTLLSRDIKDNVYGIAKLWRYLSIWIKILYLCIFNRYDLCCFAITCYGIGFLKDAPLVLICKLLRQPLVIYQHNTGMSVYAKRPVYRTLYHWVYKKTPTILLSQWLWQDISIHVPRENIIICPNGIPDEVGGLQPSSEHNTPPRLLFFSNLLQSKGILVFLDALCAIRKRGVAFTADIVGAPSAEISVEQVSSFLKAHALDKQVIVYGPCFGKDKLERFRACDIFVFPSFKEAFPLVLLEAMMFGKACVASETGGIPDIVVNGETGFLCPPCSVEELTDAIVKLLETPGLRAEMGERGRQRFEAYFTYDKYEKNFAYAITKAIRFYRKKKKQ